MNHPHPDNESKGALWPGFSAMLDAHAQQHGEGLALVDGERRIAWRELARLSRQAARWLEAQGVGPGDRVAVWLVNRWEWLVLLFALARRGACLVTVNTRYRSSELHHILKKSGASLLIYEPNFRKIDFAAVLAGVNLGDLPQLRQLAVLRPAVPVAATGPGGLTQTVCEFESLPPLEDDLSQPDAHMMMFTTSGTTKGPKLVVHTQRTLLCHTARVARANALDEAGACLLAAIPLCGVFGFNSAFAACHAKAPVVLVDAFDGDEALALMAQHRVTHLYGSDDMGYRLRERLTGPLPWLRRFGFASFVSSAEEFGLPARALGLPVLGLYGSSEVQALFSIQSPDLSDAEAIQGGGRAVGGAAVSLRIRDVETGQLLPPLQAGELEIRADTNFVGYLDDPDATAAAMTPDGYFKTGDLAYLREDGSFVYQARMGDAMRLGGFLVSPAEIEQELMGLPGVSAAQVVEARQADKPVCVAFVIAEPGAALDVPSLQSQLRGRLAAFKLPAQIWCVDRFPVTEGANGTKVQRAALRQMAAQRLQQASAAPA